MIHLSHPNHGIKIAYVESEAVLDEKNGWVRGNVETLCPVLPVSKVVAEIVPIPLSTKESVISLLPVKRKPGRPKKD